MGNRYRDLVEGDVIQSGDEWNTAYDWELKDKIYQIREGHGDIGRRYIPGRFLPMRRPI